MMRQDCRIASDEWFIPTDWESVPVQTLLDEKAEALQAAEALLTELETLEPLLEPGEYRKLWEKFCDLKLAASGWALLTKAFSTISPILRPGTGGITRIWKRIWSSYWPWTVSEASCWETVSSAALVSAARKKTGSPPLS